MFGYASVVLMLCPQVQEKNVGSDNLAGKVGRIYMPRQSVDTIALGKLKGTKREARVAAAERKAKRHGAAANGARTGAEEV
jgi:hypothetical protein